MSRKSLLPLSVLVLAVILGIAGLVLGIDSFDNVTQPRPVKIATIEWEPYVGPDLEEHGPVGKLIAETFDRMGFRSVLSYSSWDLCLEKTKRERVFGTFPGIKTPERESLYVFSAPLFSTEYVLFYRDSLEEVVQDLQKTGGLAARRDAFKFGKVKGYSVWKELEDAVPLSSFQEYQTIPAAFQALAKGEIDFLPEGKITGLLAIQAPEIEADIVDFSYVKGANDSPFGDLVDWYLLMPKENSGFIKKFNKALDSTKNKSTFQYDIEQAERNISSLIYVELQPLPGRQFVEVMERSSSSDKKKYLVPQGTRAVVYQWPHPIVESDTGNSEEWCTVKILNGPLRGRMLCVHPRFISLSTPSF